MWWLTKKLNTGSSSLSQHGESPGLLLSRITQLIHSHTISKGMCQQDSVPEYFRRACCSNKFTKLKLCHLTRHDFPEHLCLRLRSVFCQQTNYKSSRTNWFDFSAAALTASACIIVSVTHSLSHQGRKHWLTVHLCGYLQTGSAAGVTPLLPQENIELASQLKRLESSFSIFAEESNPNQLLAHLGRMAVEFHHLSSKVQKNEQRTSLLQVRNKTTEWQKSKKC